MSVTQVWTKTYLVEILDNAHKDPDGSAVLEVGSAGETVTITHTVLTYKLLRAMYARQTAEEQERGMTRHNNGVGFSGVDAEFLSSVASRSEAYGRVSTKQCIWVAKKLKKYAGQLVECLANNAAGVLGIAGVAINNASVSRAVITPEFSGQGRLF